VEEREREKRSEGYRSERDNMNNESLGSLDDFTLDIEEKETLQPNEDVPSDPQSLPPDSSIPEVGSEESCIENTIPQEDLGDLSIPPASTRKCLICHEPLEDWQQSLSAQVIHKERECGNCVYCKKPVHRERILRCIAKEDPISHMPCLEKFMKDSFESRPVTITQGHLNYLNRMIQFAYKPDMLLSLEENMDIAELANTQFIKDMSMEEKFIHMKMMEAACANASIAIHNDKEKIRLVVERRDIERHVKIRDLQKVNDVEYQREKNKADKEARTERKVIQGDPALRAREKTIESMIKMGFSREAAIEFIDKQKAKGMGVEK
jgi:hypothetical protein